MKIYINYKPIVIMDGFSKEQSDFLDKFNEEFVLHSVVPYCEFDKLSEKSKEDDYFFLTIFKEISKKIHDVSKTCMRKKYKFYERYEEKDYKEQESCAAELLHKHFLIHRSGYTSKLIISLVNENRFLLKYLDEKWKDNEEVVTAAVSKFYPPEYVGHFNPAVSYPELFQFASDRLKTDVSFIKSLDDSISIFRYIPSKLRNDKEFILDFLKYSSSNVILRSNVMLPDSDDSSDEDEEWRYNKNYINEKTHVLPFIPKYLLSDFEFIRRLVTFNHKYISCEKLSEELCYDISILNAALCADRAMVEFDISDDEQSIQLLDYGVVIQIMDRLDTRSIFGKYYNVFHVEKLVRHPPELLKYSGRIMPSEVSYDPEAPYVVCNDLNIIEKSFARHQFHHKNVHPDLQETFNLLLAQKRCLLANITGIDYDIMQIIAKRFVLL